MYGFPTLLELEMHISKSHKWTCAACQAINEATAFPECTTCGNTRDKEGEDLKQQREAEFNVPIQLEDWKTVKSKSKIKRKGSAAHKTKTRRIRSTRNVLTSVRPFCDEDKALLERRALEIINWKQRHLLREKARKERNMNYCHGTENQIEPKLKTLMDERKKMREEAMQEELNTNHKNKTASIPETDDPEKGQAFLTQNTSEIVQSSAMGMDENPTKMGEGTRNDFLRIYSS